MLALMMFSISNLQIWTFLINMSGQAGIESSEGVIFAVRVYMCTSYERL